MYCFKKEVFLILTLLFSQIASAQSGYIYVHKKGISESASNNVNFTLQNSGGTTISNFSLNDKPDAINAFDLGASHGINGEGQLWAVATSGSASANPHTVTGTIYKRDLSNSQWIATSVVDARSIDGIGSNTAVYSTSAGDLFYFNNGNTTRIWQTTAHNSVQILDVASGGTGGIIVGVGSDGRLYKYTGNLTNDSWVVFSNVSNSTPTAVYRVDVHPATQDVYFIRSTTTSTTDLNVYVIPSANPATATATTIAPDASFSRTFANNPRYDIAVSDDGTVFSNYMVLSPQGTSTLYICEYNGSWFVNEQSRSLSGQTAGIGNQVWAINKVNANIIQHSIFTRMSDGTWLDDERIRTNFTGNSIVIPVPAGTYTLTETVPSGWNNSEIRIYDPTNNSSFTLPSSTSTINVAAGELVNVVYNNTLENPVPVPGVCSANYLVTFGNGTAQFGAPLNGFTAYHHSSTATISDGYYSMQKNSLNWFATGNLNLTNHTPNDPNGYFGLFNAAYSKDDFFRQRVIDLVPGTQYEFAFWVADLSPNASIRPNVTMGIVDDTTGVLLASLDTGNITSTVWKRYTFVFTATSTSGEIFLKNNSVGGSGNDLAIDDISFSPAPPPLSPIQAQSTTLCSNAPLQNYQFTINETGGTWSSDDTSKVTIDPNTGVATPVLNAVGTTMIRYTYVSNTGCISEASTTITLVQCACYNDANTSVVGIDSKHGISVLQRAGNDGDGNTANDWPMTRKSAHTVLESNTKGFVITRMTTSQITAIASPQEGMFVYDTTTKCLKIYDGATWSCFSTPACP